MVSDHLEGDFLPMVSELHSMVGSVTDQADSGKPLHHICDGCGRDAEVLSEARGGDRMLALGQREDRLQVVLDGLAQGRWHDSEYPLGEAKCTPSSYTREPDLSVVGGAASHWLLSC